VGAGTPLAGAGVIAAAATLACLFIPGMRETERRERLGAVAREPG